MTDDGTAPLTLELLGPFALKVNGAPARPLRSQKGQGLLALLALRQGREVSRAWLAQTLWPDSEIEEAQTSLRQSLSDLRRALSDQAGRLASSSTKMLCLDLTGAEVDVLRFDQAIAKGDTEALEKAVALYRRPFMEDCLEAWAFQEREKRQQDYLKALETLAMQAMADGSPDRAVAYLRPGVETDLSHQSLHRALMQAYAKQGDYESALQVFQELRRRLFASSYGEPQPETQALYQTLRDQARRRSRPAVLRSAPLAGPPPCHLPRPLTPLIGREQAVQEITALLLSTRLVTLTGTGGIGKTRLAIQSAQEMAENFTHGVWFAALESLSHSNLLPQTVAALLGAPEERGKPHLDSLVEYLQSRQLLLVLDNCEHLIEACAELARTLLRECAGLTLLATSREKLGLMGETVWRVPSLAIPEEDQDDATEGLQSSPAIRLFAERAHAAQNDFALSNENLAEVTQICRRLDGIPYAIELAAALVESLPVAEIVTRLNDRFQLLDSGDRTLPARQRTLRAMIDWSYDLLSGPERLLLARLSVFSGGWTLQAAEAVCSDGEELQNWQVVKTHSRLVTKSLVMTGERDGQPRSHLLETMRQYGRELLEKAQETEPLRRAHYDYFRRMAAEAEPELVGPTQQTCLILLEADHTNLRHALEGQIVSLTETEQQDTKSETQNLLRFSASLGRFWQIRGYFSEGRDLLLRILALPQAQDRTAERADALTWAGLLCLFQGDYATARPLCEEGLSIWQKLHDDRGIAGALGCLGILVKDQGDPAGARRLFEESLKYGQAAGDRAGVAGSLGYLGIVAIDMGDTPAAFAYFEQSLALRRELQDRWGIAASLNNLGVLHRKQGRYTEAKTYLEESLELRRHLGDRRNIAVCLNNLGLIACQTADFSQARACFEESMRLSWDLGERRSLAYSLEAFARLAQAEEEWDRAVTLWGAAAALRETIGSPLTPPEQALHQQNLEAARNTLGTAAFEAALSRGDTYTLEKAMDFCLASPFRTNARNPARDSA